MKNTLVRERLSGVQVSSSTFRTIREQAVTCLGYKGLGVLTEQEQHNITANAFDALEIHPFRHDSVVEFMATKVDELNSAEMDSQSRRRLKAKTDVVGGIMLIAMMTTVCSLLFAVFTKSMAPFGFAAIAAGVFAYFSMILKNLPSPKTYEWKQGPFHSYEGEIPHFVLSMAVGLKRLIPSAEFQVHEIGEDPLYSVTIFGSEYFFAQSDEPGFHAPRVI